MDAKRTQPERVPRNPAQRPTAAHRVPAEGAHGRAPELASGGHDEAPSRHAYPGAAALAHASLRVPTASGVSRRPQIRSSWPYPQRDQTRDREANSGAQAGGRGERTPTHSAVWQLPAQQVVGQRAPAAHASSHPRADGRQRNRTPVQGPDRRTTERTRERQPAPNLQAPNLPFGARGLLSTPPPPAAPPPHSSAPPADPGAGTSQSYGGGGAPARSDVQVEFPEVEFPGGDDALPETPVQAMDDEPGSAMATLSTPPDQLDEGTERRPSPAPERAPWADVDTMLIPEATLARSQGGRGFAAGFSRIFGLSSGSGSEASRGGTVLAVLAGVVVVVGALFADRIVMSTVQRRIEAEATMAPSVSAIPYTRIVSSPPAADVVAQGQVVGQTPLSVARGQDDAVVVVRKPGYESQILRVGPNSPSTLQIALVPSVP